MKIFLIIVACIAVAILAANMVTELRKTCVTGTFIVPDEYGSVWVLGDQQLCGYRLHFGPIVGPSGARGFDGT